MSGFWRSLFGWGDESDNRKVVGAPVDFGAQEAEYIQNSTQRLNLLQELAVLYDRTPHKGKMRQAYLKTKNIHAFLVSKKKVHALEIFHLQNTDHFINTFRIILQVHQDHQASADSGFSDGGNGVNAGKHEPTPRIMRVEKAPDLPEMVKPLTTSGSFPQGADARAPVPRLYVPDISINTFEKITFLHENAAGQLVAHHVGSTSSKEEKDIFLQHVGSRMGLEAISYVGNAHLTIPNSNGITPTGIVPIIHWEGFLYALNLNDYRLFPVRIYRKGL